MKTIELSETTGARLSERFDQVPFARLLGLQLGYVAHGTAIVQMDVRGELKQNEGLLHGGVIASLIDTAAAFAVLTLLEETEQASTINLVIDYLQPVTSGGIVARASVQRTGRHIIFLSVNVSNESQALVATALVTFSRFSRR